jgi:hypothetical protein
MEPDDKGLSTSTPCPFCKGSGRCANCDGSGCRLVRKGFLGLLHEADCRACEGSGECQLCHGSARVAE